VNLIIQPHNAHVSWPIDEGVIGVVGVAPWATLDYCRKIYQLSPASKDWHYPRMIIDANTKIPSRGRHLELGEVDPSSFIKETIKELAVAGATVVVVPCNTAHILYSRWADNSPVSVISIIDATMLAMPSKKNMSVAVLSSRYLSESCLYQKHLCDAGYTSFELSTMQQDVISSCIETLKQQPFINSSNAKELTSLVKTLQLQGVEAVILACTELSILNEDNIWGDLAVVDSNTELAKSSLRAIGISCIDDGGA